MRSPIVVPVLLAVCLVSTVALAANDRVQATFQSFSASGVIGDAELNPIPAGGTLIHTTLRGLQPNTEYVSRLYEADQSCGVATSSDLIVSFVSNPAGMARWNEKVVQDLSSIRSISVQLASDNSVQACASVTP